MTRIFTLSFLFLSVWSALAQTPSNIYYKGLGRTLVHGESLDNKSNYINNDTSSDRRALDGQFIFDLGIHIEPNEQVKVKTIMRLSSKFGDFWFVTSLFQFRQATIEGVLAKKFWYQIGDMDVKLSPYTLFNNADSWYDFESTIFRDRRSIMQYENFNTGNNWRMQGVQAKTSWKFAKWCDSLVLHGLTARSRASNILTTPDRLLAGGQLQMIGKKWIDLGARATQFFDVTGTSKDSVKRFTNSVFSVNGALKYTTDDVDIRLEADGGISDYFKENKTKAKGTYNAKGDFFETGLKVKAKKAGIHSSIVYRQVSPEFYSAAAQSRRVDDYGTSAMLAVGGNGTLARPQTLADRYQALNLYNNKISDQLARYYVPYNLVNPYGDATPNRQGIIFSLGYNTPDSIVIAKGSATTQREMQGEGTTDKRSFVEIGGGVSMKVNKLIKMKKNLILSAGYKSSQMNRKGGNLVDINANYMDLGIEIEVFNQLDVLLGYKAFNAKGYDYVANRDAYNRIVSIGNSSLAIPDNSYDIEESTFAVGLKYRLSRMSHFSINYSNPSYKSNTNSKLNYFYNQWFANFSLFF